LDNVHCAFLVTFQPKEGNIAAALSGTLSGTATGSGEVAFGGTASTMTHHKNVLCELREQFTGFRKVLNYTVLLPQSMITSGGASADHAAEMCVRTAY
jgi:hypothetical protein